MNKDFAKGAMTLKSKLSYRITNKIFYADLGKDEFDSAYSKIADSMINENVSNLRPLTVIASALFGLMMIASMFVPDLSDYRTLYIAMFLVSVGTFIANEQITKKSIKVTRSLSYAFVFLVFIFSIILGTVYSPNELSATYMVLIVAAPLVFVEKPIYFGGLEIITYFIFVIMEVAHKSGRWLVIDLTNGTVFTIFAIFTCIYVMNSKLHKLILEMRLDERSTTDVLTGMKNRRSYEDDIDAYDIGLLDKTYMIYIDVNGLHELNDSQGHEAGDEMLKFISAEIKSVFNDHTYRIGGDEFVAFGADRTAQQVRVSINSLKAHIAEKGYAVSVGCVMGADATDIRDLVKMAEKEMYKAKTEYYRDRIHDRRRV